MNNSLFTLWAGHRVFSETGCHQRPNVLSIIGYCRFPQTGCRVPGSGFGGGSLGLLLGVWTLQILMKPAISMMRAMPINSTAHQ